MAKAYSAMQNCWQRPLDWNMLLSTRGGQYQKGTRREFGDREGLLVGVVPVFMLEHSVMGIEAARFDIARTRAATRRHRPDSSRRKAMAVDHERMVRSGSQPPGWKEGDEVEFIESDGRRSQQRNVPLNGQSTRDPHQGEGNTTG